MWRKPTEAQPSSQGSDASASSKTQNVAQPSTAAAATAPAPVLPSQPAPSFSPSAAEPVAAPVSRSTSKIASGLKINGELSGNTDLYIDGEVQGKIRLSDARVTVGPSGRVQADIEAREIVIDGSVQGNLKASESTRLGPASRVSGSVLTPRIGIEDGARLRGKVEMTTANPARKSSTAAVAASVSETLQPETAA